MNAVHTCPSCGGTVHLAEVPLIARVGVLLLVITAAYSIIVTLVLTAIALEVPSEAVAAIGTIAFLVYVAARHRIEAKLRGIGAAPLYICGQCRRRFSASSVKQLPEEPTAFSHQTYKPPLWFQIVSGSVALVLVTLWWLWAVSFTQHLLVAAGFGVLFAIGKWVRSAEERRAI
jgi:hypothetical protein